MRKQRIGFFFFYPTASPTVAFRNGTDSLKRPFPAVPSQEAGQFPGLFSRPGGARLGNRKDLVSLGYSQMTLRENYCPNNSK